MIIAVDAMGGDFAPDEIVKGALDAVGLTPNLNIILVGDRKGIEVLIDKSAQNAKNIQIEHTPEVIGMREEPMRALREKKDASIVRCIQITKDHIADALVSAGNTGATVAASTFSFGMLEGINRLGIAVPIPTKVGYSVLIDAGANINCKPMHLFQYGIMASLYLKYTLRSDIKDPRIGLLNIGEEETKGNELLKETYDMFKRSSLNFIGNIEPHDIFQGICDVIVCDGFLGNIILKMGEGLSTFVYEEISKKFKEQGKVMTNIKETLNRMDYSEYGGVPLLGINGIVVKCHGRSRAKAITNAISAAQNFASLRINELIVEEIKRHSEIRS